MKEKFTYIISIILAVLLGLFLYNKFRVAPSIKFDQLSLSDLKGKPVKFNDFRGKKMVVCFGASWCGNCWEELKTLKKIKDGDLADVEIVVISDEPFERILNFKERGDFPFTFLKMEQAFSSIGINSIPTSYIVNTKLEIKKETVGYLDWEDAATVEHLKKLME